MEPRSFNRGDGPAQGDLGSGQVSLQWSHGRLTVVTRRRWWWCRPRSPWLQWSHGRLTVVTPFDEKVALINRMLQWSHGRLTVGTELFLKMGKFFYLASMEPRSFNRGDRQA